MSNGGAYWSVGVTAVRRSQETLTRTLESVAAAGWSDVLVHFDGERRGPYPSFLHLLGLLVRTARTNGRPSFCVVFQDDILVTEGLREALEDDASLPCNGVVSLYAPAAHQKRPVLGWSQVLRLPHSYGAQGLVFPLSVAQRLLCSPAGEKQDRMTDYWVSKFCDDQNVPYYLPGVSFVKHATVASSLKNPSINASYRQCRFWQPAAGGPIEEVVKR